MNEQPPATFESTAIHPRPVAPSPAIERPRVAFVPAIKAAPSELASLLQRRLRIVTAAAFVACIAWAACLLAEFPPFSLTTTGRYAENPLLGRTALAMTLVTATLEGLAWCLLKRWRLSLPALRWVEVLVFGPLVAFFVEEDVACIVRFTPEVLRLGGVLSASAGMGWPVLMLVYGVMIPSTGRRCVVVVGLMALVGLVNYAVGLSVQGVPPATVIHFLATQAIWLGLAAALVAFAASRGEGLRQQLLQARRLGQYVLGRRLGSGGMGEVYFAEHALLRRPCAVKLIRPDHTANPNLALRFEREVKATATLSHPNTVQIYDYGRAEDGTLYYAMEYLNGFNLEELVQATGPLPPGRAIYLLRQVAGALGEAHGIGLIHRDIKPANVIVCEHGGRCDVAKLLDFGLVHLLDAGEGAGRLTQEGGFVGTPAYLAPEQLDGSGRMDTRTDLYSLGALAYFLLTGRPAFADRTLASLLMAQLNEVPAPPSRYRRDLPADLEAVVLRCLAKEPARRFASAEELDRALAHCCSFGTWSEAEAAAWWRSRSRRADEDPLAQQTTS
jgi:serine/threonine-protein kinase